MPDPLPQIRLKIARHSSHPWIFQKMVEKPAHHARHRAAVVDILDRDGQWVGRGFYNGHSRISLRVLTTNPRRSHRRRFFRQAASLRPSPCAATGSASTPSPTPTAWSIPRATA